MVDGRYEYKKELNRFVSDCGSEGIEITPASLAHMIKTGHPLIEIEGVLYMAVAELKNRREVSH